MVHTTESAGADTSETADRRQASESSTRPAASHINNLAHSLMNFNSMNHPAANLTAANLAAANGSGSAISAAILQELRRQHDAILFQYGPTAAAVHVREASMRLQSQASALQMRYQQDAMNTTTIATTNEGTTAAATTKNPQQPLLNNHHHPSNSSDGNNSISTDTSSVTGSATQPANAAPLLPAVTGGLSLNPTATTTAASAAVPQQVLVQFVPMAGGGFAAVPMTKPTTTTTTNMLAAPPNTTTNALEVLAGIPTTVQTTQDVPDDKQARPVTANDDHDEGANTSSRKKHDSSQATTRNSDGREPPEKDSTATTSFPSSKRSRAQQWEEDEEDEEYHRHHYDNGPRRASLERGDYDPTYPHPRHQRRSHPPVSKKERGSGGYYHGQHPGESHQEQHHHHHRDTQRYRHGSSTSTTHSGRREYHAKPGMERFLCKVFLGEEGYSASLLRNEEVVLTRDQLVYVEKVLKDARRRENTNHEQHQRPSMREYDLQKEVQRLQTLLSEQSAEQSAQIERLTAERDRARRQAEQDAQRGLDDRLAKQKKEYERALRAYMKSSVHSLHRALGEQ